MTGIAIRYARCSTDKLDLPRQAYLRKLHAARELTIAELLDVSRPTVHRALERATDPVDDRAGAA